MKKLILFLIVVLLGITTFAQETIVALNNGKIWNLKKNGVRFVYTGTVDDTLKATTSDTIMYTLKIGDMNRQNRPLHFHMNISSKGLTGTDTTFSIQSDYKISNTNTTYSELVPDITSAVNPTTGINTTVTSYGIISDYTTVQTVAAFDVPFTNPTLATADTLEYPAQTYTITNMQNEALHYRYMRFYFIISGDDSVGTGIEIEEIEIIFDL